MTKKSLSDLFDDIGAELQKVADALIEMHDVRDKAVNATLGLQTMLAELEQRILVMGERS